MNTVLFKMWLIENGNSVKITSDTISRLKKLNQSLIESSISSSIDYEFNKDNCEQLLKCFFKNGKNDIMNIYNLTSLPIGKRYIYTYKTSLVKYILFKKEYPNG